MDKRGQGEMNERSDGNEMCVRNHKHQISSLQTQWRRSDQMKDGSGGPEQHRLQQVGCRVVDSLDSIWVDVLDWQLRSGTLLHSRMTHLNKGSVDSISHKEQSHNCTHLPSLNNDSVHSESLVPCKEGSQCCSS